MSPNAIANVFSLKYGFGKITSQDDLDGTLTHIEFDDDFNWGVNLDKCVNLEHVNFGNNFNQPIDITNCHVLERISFGRCFGQPIDFLGEIPSLKYISLPHHLYTDPDRNATRIDYPHSVEFLINKGFALDEQLTMYHDNGDRVYTRVLE